MKQEEVQEAIVSVLMQEDEIGFSLLCKKTEKCLQETRDENYNLHDDWCGPL